jgi:xeroderma pigmentosum group C-complementing protein
MHSRIQAARARVQKAKKDAERIDAARRGRGKNGGHPPRRKGSRSVEEVAAAMSKRENGLGANGNPGGGVNGEEEEEEEGEVFLYGEWQTEPWDPPAAKDGVVPKNDRGNVDLHGAALPPPGTVHVNLPRIARVARALGIDYASALVGFEFHRGGKTTPKFEGVVVCEEFEGRLREAHAEEEARLVAAKAERERREAKARWRVLFSAMWTRLSLREEFAMDDGDDNGDGGGEPDEREKTREEETVDRERRGGGKRARLVADEEDGENDGGTKRVRLGAAAEVEEL